jgi:signal peptidase I
VEAYAHARLLRVPAGPKPSRGAVRRVLDALVVAALVVIAAALLASVLPRLLGYGTLAVMSGSMGREAPTGSLVLGHEKARDEVARGDVIVARRRTAAGVEQAPVLHRVVSITREGERVVVRTKGDANPAADPEPYELPATVLTKAHAVPLLGYLVGFVKGPIGFLLVIAFPAIVLAASTLYRIWAPLAAPSPDETLRATPPTETAALPVETDAAAEPEPAAAATGTYVFFAPGPRGYWLVEASGPVPGVGTAIGDDSGRRYVVSMVARSPLPDDQRPCVYLLPT